MGSIPFTRSAPGDPAHEWEITMRLNITLELVEPKA